MKTEERWADGLAFEEMYQKEVSYFHNAKTGVDHEQVAAALVLRVEGRMELLKLLHEGKIKVLRPVDFDFDEVNELQFRVV
jgi:hypothetical protein